MLKVSLSGATKGVGEFGPGIGRTHVDDPHRLAHRACRQLGSHAPPLGRSGGRAHAAFLPRWRPSCLRPTADAPDGSSMAWIVVDIGERARAHLAYQFWPRARRRPG